MHRCANCTLVDYVRIAAHRLVKIHLCNCIDYARIAGHPKQSHLCNCITRASSTPSNHTYDKMVHQDVMSALGADQMQKVCDFTDKEKEAAQKEIDEDKRKRLELQADMGKFLLLLGFGMLYYFWVSYDVVPPIIDRAAQLGFARFARVGDLKALCSGGSGS